MAEEEYKGPSKPLSKMYKWLAGIVLITGIIILIIIKIAYPEFAIGWVILIGFILFVVAGALYVGFEIPKFLKGVKEDKSGDKKIPKPITIKEAKELVDKIMESKTYMNEVYYPIEEGVEEHGKGGNQKIYSIHFKAKHKNNGQRPDYFVGINLHFPDTNVKIIENPSVNKMTMAKRKLAIDPEDSPDTRVTEEESPLTGVKRKITETTRKKKEEPKKKEGDLR